MSPSSNGGVKTQAAYFFISYAHLPPLPPVPGLDEEIDRSSDWEADPVVKYFYNDLMVEVSALVPRNTELRIGLYDQDVGTGPDQLSGLTNALGAAEVLVPLYSPRYVAGIWAMAERESFYQRLSLAAANPAGHVQPIVWVPLAPGRSLPDDGEVDDIGADIPEYAENGLRVLRDLPPYREAYQTIVNRLARRIVDVVRRSPIGPSQAPPPVAAIPTPAADARFVVAVTAPTSAEATGRELWYGAQRRDWHPRGDAGDLSIARQAASVAERFDLPTVVVDLPGGEAELLRLPTVLLVDPWIAVSPRGRSLLESVVRQPPDWLTALVAVDVGDPAVDPSGTALLPVVTDILASARVRFKVVDVDDPDRLGDVMRDLVVQTRRRFLHSPSARFGRRPTLGGPDPSSSMLAEGDPK